MTFHNQSIHGIPSATHTVLTTGQQVVTASPPQTVYLHPICHHPVYEHFQSKQSGWLGATQITVGLGCLVFNAVGIGIQADMSFIGHGIWCGLFFILTGSLVISAGKSKSACTVIGSLVMCVISTVLCVIILCLSSFGASIAKTSPTTATCGYFYYLYAPCQKSTVNAKIAMNGLLVTLALLEGFVAVWSAALCCGAACCSTLTNAGTFVPQSQNAQNVQYLPGPPPAPSVVVISGGQPLAFHGHQPAQLIVPQAQPQDDHQMRVGPQSANNPVMISAPMAPGDDQGAAQGFTQEGDCAGNPPAYSSGCPPVYMYAQREETKASV